MTFSYTYHDQWRGCDIVTIKHTPEAGLIDLTIGSGLRVATTMPHPFFNDVTQRLRSLRAKDLGVGYVTNMLVQDKGQGIGSRLMKEALRYLKERNVSLVILHAVPDSPALEDALLRFYASHSFVQMKNATKNWLWRTVES